MKANTEKLKLTPIKDIKPQLLCIGQLLGMDLYIDVRGQNPKKYDIAQEILQKAFYPPDEKEETNSTGGVE